MGIKAVSKTTNPSLLYSEDINLSIFQRIKRIWQLIYELIIKEIGSVLISALYYFLSFFYTKYSVTCIAPKDIKETTKENLELPIAYNSSTPVFFWKRKLCAYWI